MVDFRSESIDSNERTPKVPLGGEFVKNIGINLYYLSNCDPFAIYKGTYKLCTENKYKNIYLRPELRIAPGDSDRRILRLRHFSLICYAIIAIRFSMICFVQLVKYQATIYVLDPLTDTWQRQEIIETNLIRLLKKCYIYYLFDNVLSDFPGVSLMVHILLLVWIVCSIFVMPYYYTYKPIDCINFRIGIDFQRERKRIDIVLREEVESLLSSLETYKFHCRIISSDCHESRMLRLRHQRSSIRMFGNRDWENKYQVKKSIGIEYDARTLRSYRYTANYYKETYRAVTYFTCIIIPVFLSVTYMAISYIVRWTLGHRCKMRHITQEQDCTFVNNVDKFEYYSIFELVSVLFLLGAMLGSSVVTILGEFTAVSIAIREMKSDLAILLFQLRQMNGHNIWLKNRAKNSDHIMKRHQVTSFLAIDSNHYHGVLLKVLAKTRVFLNEYRDQTAFLSEQCSVFLFIYYVSLVLTLMASKMRGPDMKDLRINVISYVWIFSNIIMIACAHQYVRIISLQKIGWSILAQLNSRLNINLNKKNPTACSMMDPLTVGWYRFIQLEKLVDVRNSVRPFGISMTFKRVFQFNFYVTSLAALVVRS